MAPEHRPAIALEGVQVVYRKGKEGRTTALDDTTLEVGPREFVSLLGPSGCGKTTLLKVVGGLIRPTRGKVSVLGGSVEEALKRRSIGFVFQDANLLPWRTVGENARLLAEIIDRKAIDDRRIRGLLDEVGLAGFEDAYPRQLSGGMRQRVGIVRALAFDPGLLLMDEPFAALDALTRDRMAEMLLEVWGGARPVLFVTHSIEEAAFLSDRVVVMSARPGRVLEEIPIDLPRPRTREMRDTPDFLACRRRLRQVVDRAQSDEGGA
ncbi:MAG TPA: ABC transporter ATP-binding protein [Acidimicrobiales bacterium]|nr:ABC transporter ATP-binding protein [Acidimicrobiales bacterium]